MRIWNGCNVRARSGSGALQRMLPLIEIRTMSSATRSNDAVSASMRTPSPVITQRIRITVTEITCGERNVQQYERLGEDENCTGQYGHVDIIKQFKEERSILVLEVSQMQASLSEITALIEHGPFRTSSSPGRPF